jgi:AcrR family transcriptional regulator
MNRRLKSKPSPLSRERVLDAADEVLAKLGPQGFSMRALGSELGVEAMSLYHYFPSKAHIFDALLDRWLTSIPAPDPELSWRERLKQAAVAYRKTLLKRPAFAQIALVHRTNTRAGLTYLESISRLIAEAGFSMEQSARIFRSVGYYLSGALLDETRGYAQGPSAAEPVMLEEQAQIAPTLIAMGRWFRADSWEKTFEFGLDALLDEFEAMRQALSRDDCL